MFEGTEMAVVCAGVADCGADRRMGRTGAGLGADGICRLGLCGAY